MNILNWCADKTDSRTYIQQPFGFNGKIAATNGHVLIVTKTENTEFDDCTHSITRTINDIIDEINGSQFTNFDTTKINPKNLKHEVDCHECDGAGSINFENEYNDYDVECKSCDGEGTTLKDLNSVEFMGKNFAESYLSLITCLNGVKISCKPDRILFTSDEGMGVVMSIREDRVGVS